MPAITLKLYKITWDAPDHDGGSKIIDYQIRFSTNQGYTDWINLESTDTRCVALLPVDVINKVEVRAENDVGPGKAAAENIYTDIKVELIKMIRCDDDI